jgi:transposase
MSLDTNPQRRLNFSQATIEPLIPEGNFYRVVKQEIVPMFKDADFKAMYSEHGRRAISPTIISLVSIFQFYEDLPDRQAAQAVVMRLDWKYALGLEIDDSGFHFSVLERFRDRLEASSTERLVFEKVLERLEALGYLKKQGRKRIDTTAVLAKVRELSRLELFTETLRLALEKTEELDQDLLARIGKDLVDKYEDFKVYKLTHDERRRKMLECAKDMEFILGLIDSYGNEVVKSTEAIVLLRRVFAENFEVVEGNIPDEKIKLLRNGFNYKEKIVTPHDAEARYGKVREKGWVGYKVQFTETVDEDKPRFITDVQLENAQKPEAEIVLAMMEQRELRKGDECDVDTAYISGETLAKAKEKGIELIGPTKKDTSKNEIKQEEFKIDLANGEAFCPQGKKSISCVERKDGSIRFRFGKECCGCPLAEKCTKSKGGRTLEVNPHYQLIQERREYEKTEEFREAMNRRNGIEGTISEAVRSCGARRSRYKGKQRTGLQQFFTATAINIKRLARALKNGISPPQLVEAVV